MLLLVGSNLNSTMRLKHWPKSYAWRKNLSEKLPESIYPMICWVLSFPASASGNETKVNIMPSDGNKACS
jgi:hypothetical protein